MLSQPVGQNSPPTEDALRASRAVALASEVCYTLAVGSKFAPGLREDLSSKGNAQVRLLLRIQGDPDKARHAVEQAGLRIIHTYRLQPGFAVSGPASAALSIANASWLARIEPDRPVRSQRKA